tara:strand:- start:349 stop:663 length:315 start_codon:yes stop_codon:yes gene_type:complete
MSFKSNGNLDKLRKNLSELSGASEVKLVDLMDAEFVSGCSQYSSLEELFEASGFKIESKEDFSAIPDDEWEQFITSSTTFDSWLEMQKSAVASYAKKKLLGGLK